MKFTYFLLPCFLWGAPVYNPAYTQKNEQKSTIRITGHFQPLQKQQYCAICNRKAHFYIKTDNLKSYRCGDHLPAGWKVKVESKDGVTIIEKEF